MSARFDQPFLDRLQRQYSHADVRMLVAQIDEMLDRGKPVLNPKGLLITWARKAHHDMAKNLKAHHNDQGRHTEWMVRLLRNVSAHQLGPRAIADAMAIAKTNGFPQLSSDLILELRKLGDQWPATPGGIHA